MAKKYISINNVTISGRLTEDAKTNDAKSFARFSIAHNFGKDSAVYPEFVMFTKNGKSVKEIPFDLLKKGTPVRVDAFLYPATDKDGKPNGYQFIVKAVEPLAEAEADADTAEEEKAEEKAE